MFISNNGKKIPAGSLKPCVPLRSIQKMLCVACEISYLKTAVPLLNGFASPPNGEN